LPCCAALNTPGANNRSFSPFSAEFSSGTGLAFSSLTNSSVAHEEKQMDDIIFWMVVMPGVIAFCLTIFAIVFSPEIIHCIKSRLQAQRNRDPWKAVAESSKPAATEPTQPEAFACRFEPAGSAREKELAVH
jgi:hypothetical protein